MMNLEGYASGTPPNPSWAEPVLERLLTAYSRHFDIDRGWESAGVSVPAKASFHSRSERYVLTKKARLWAAECNEHVLFFVHDRLTAADVRAATALLKQAEPELVKPHGEHMYTYLSAVFLANAAEPEALRLLKRFRFRKNYRFSIYGWCTIRLAAFVGERQAVVANGDGKELRKTLSKILFPKSGKKIA